MCFVGANCLRWIASHTIHGFWAHACCAEPVLGFRGFINPKPLTQAGGVQQDQLTVDARVVLGH